MALFSWFSNKLFSAPLLRTTDSRDRSAAAPDGISALNAQDLTNRAEVRKARRHARREQLFIAVRESMTRAGVLAASYKFKVLSLDLAGDKFLVMLDVDPNLGHQTKRLAEIEVLVVQSAKARSNIFVTSVYWRMDSTASPAAVSRQGHKGTATAATKPAGPSPTVPVTARYEPIQDDELVAFKQALAASSGTHRPTLGAVGKSRSGAHSYTLLTGFEDTELSEAVPAPALSATQYGDLK